MAEQAPLAYPATLYGGTPPYAKGVDTSRAAAESVRQSSAVVRTQILTAIAAAGPAGLTIDELAARRGSTPNAISPRIRELTLLERIKDSGARRRTRSGRTAIAWVRA